MAKMKRPPVTIVELSIFKIYKEEDGQKGFTEIEPSKITENHESFFCSVVADQIVKKPDISSGSSCKAYGFPEDGECKKQADEDKELLNDMLLKSEDCFHNGAERIVNRYCDSPHSHEGYFFVSVVDLSNEEEVELEVIAIAHFNYEEVYEAESMNSLEEAVSRKLGKVITYPYYDGFERYFSHLKCFQKSSTSFFHRIFTVTTPSDYNAIYENSLKEASKEVLGEKHNEDLFEIGFPNKRKAFEGEKGFVPPENLLNTDEVDKLAFNSAIKNQKEVQKDQYITLKIDQKITVRFPIDTLIRNIKFGESDSGIKTMLISFDEIENSGPLNPVDFMKIEGLEKALES